MKKIFQRSANSSVAWRNLSIDGVQSTAGAPQIYCDKSKISLSAKSLDFYFLHITYEDFRVNCGISNISTRRSPVAYLSVKFYCDGVVSNSKETKSSFKSLDLLSAHHERLENTLYQLSNNATNRFSAMTSDTTQLWVHRFISF